MEPHEVMLAAIGDLEVTRRQLIMEIQAREARIAELEARVEELEALHPNYEEATA